MRAHGGRRATTATLVMKESIRAKLMGLCRRLEEIDATLAAPDAADDMNRFRSLSQERAEIEPVTIKMREYTQTEENMRQAEELLNDPEMADFAADEIKSGKQHLIELEHDLEVLLLPRDPNDDRNTFLEIRAGTGGEESALFAGDLLRMYMRYAERQGWKVEIVSKNESDLGGYREVICRIIGQGAYSKLKFESGGHRVQRVPATEAAGRIHTSACTVAVMPELDEVEAVKINPADLRIDVYRASGAGGQHVQKTDSAVRITHLPTGLVVECQDERSQRQNKDRAMAVLAARLYAAEVEKQRAQEASTRKSLIGSGDRSERIRTYNYPQGRVTDHRINLTLYRLDSIMDGDIDEIITALTSEHQAEQLAAMGEEGMTDTVGTLLAAAAGRAPRSDARLVLAHLLKTTKERLIMHPELEVAPEVKAAYLEKKSRAAAPLPTSRACASSTAGPLRSRPTCLCRDPTPKPSSRRRSPSSSARAQKAFLISAPAAASSP